MTRAAALGARALTSVMRCAGRARPSLTSATITGVAAVAAIVPAPQKCETTSAATTDAAEAMTSVGRSMPPPRAGGGGGGAGWRRVRVSWVDTAARRGHGGGTRATSDYPFDGSGSLAAVHMENRGDDRERHLATRAHGGAQHVLV